ncbi:uncharacterized protein LOC121380617 [Gigantopelta aegis]|uniref:uncharacterized protein LOC121380617 n=1 Tax=Gigantopelta aegis TaxID=1735272 RepID=UPI001B88DBF1|nr:uncharacterized protein LOC121380617 [Gigantopelta aegis]
MTKNRVCAIFEHLYDDVFSLVDWLHQFRNERKFHGEVLLESDSPSYRNLLETTIIGVTSPAKPLPAGITFSQDSHQREIVLRVIERLYNRKGAGKNILTLGFGPVS